MIVMDLLLVSPMEYSLSDKSLFREANANRDVENINKNAVNRMYIKRNRENLGVHILAAHLRSHDFSVEILNGQITEETLGDTVREIIKANPHVVAVSLLYDLHIYNAIKISQKLRTNGYKGHITFGGPFVTFAYEYFLSSVKEIDSVIRGEGEIPLLNLVNSIKSGEEWNNIAGLAYKNGTKIIKNAPAPVMKNLNQMVRPSRDMLKSLKSQGIHMRVASVLASRGCNGKCTYCTAPASTKLSNHLEWRYRPVDDLLDEIEYLVKEFNIEFLYFCDYNFFGYGEHSEKWLHTFADGILNRKIKVRFHATVRADSQLNSSLMLKLKEAGLQYVLLGVESGSQSALDRWKKRTTTQQNKDTIKTIRDLGFELDPGMIMVDPYTSLNEFKDTVNFIEETGLHECFFPMYLFNQIIAFPGTELEEELVKDGIIKLEDPLSLDDDLYHDDDLLSFCRKISSRPYEIRDEIVRDLWSEVTVQTNLVTWLVEDEIPEILSIWRLSIKNCVSKEVRKAEEKKYLNFVSSLRKWRKNIGALALQLMKESVKWGNKRSIDSSVTRDELRVELEAIVHAYDCKWMKGPLPSLINEHRLRLSVESASMNSSIS